MSFVRALWVATSLWVLLCLPPVAVADDASDRAALEAAAQAWIKAFNAHDVEALVARSTSDVVLMDGGGTSPVSGSAAARKTWERAGPVGDGQLTSVTKEAVIIGDIAWRISTVALKLPNSGEARNQSLEIWKRAHGEWKLHRQMSSNLLAPGDLSPPNPSQPIYDKPTN